MRMKTKMTLNIELQRRDSTMRIHHNPTQTLIINTPDIEIKARATASIKTNLRVKTIRKTREAIKREKNKMKITKS